MGSHAWEIRTEKVVLLHVLVEQRPFTSLFGKTSSILRNLNGIFGILSAYISGGTTFFLPKYI